MKKLIALTFIIFTLSCSKQDKDQKLTPFDSNVRYGTKFDKLLIGVESKSDVITLTQSLDVFNQGITLPTGTIIKKRDNDFSTFDYILPEGYKLVSKMPIGRAMMTTAGTITCSCNKGTGCSPFIASLGSQQVIGCAMKSTCTECTQKTTAVVNNQETSLTNPEIIDFNQKIHFVTSKAELAQLTSPRSLMDLKEVQSEVAAFAKGYQLNDLDKLSKSTGPNDVPSTYVYVHVNVYGRVILLPVEIALTQVSNPLLNELVTESPNGRLSTAAYSCSCSSGTSGCSLSKRSLIGQAVWCEAGNCRTCTLSY